MRILAVCLALTVGQGDLQPAPADPYTVFVSRGEQFYMTGYVRDPGAYEFHEGLTVAQALERAGGMTEHGDAQRITIQRVKNGKRTKIRAKMDTPIRAGDVIHVDRARVSNRCCLA